MSMRKFVWLLSFLILVVGIGSAAYIVGFYENPFEVPSIYPNDARLWDRMLQTEDPEELDSEPLGVVIPHHLIASDKTAQFYANLAETIDPSVVVIIGPNHFELNPEDAVQTCLKCVYTTTFGNVIMQEELVQKFVNDGVGRAMDKNFLTEHAIFAHSPFVKKFFPEAQIMPILLQWETSEVQATELATWLDENLPEDALVIASVDFSHYLPVNAAEFHDYSSYATIRNFDYGNVYDLEIDSPASIFTLLQLMEMRGAQSAERIFHTNSQDYLSDIQRETTSHQFFTFSEGAIEQTRGLGLMVFGNLPDNEDLSLSNGWKWDRAYDQATDQNVTKYLRDVRSTEDRFLVGTDFLVFDLKEEGCFKDGQNYTDVAFCRIVEDGKDAQEELLRKAVADSSVIYVEYEFVGGGELTSEREAEMKRMADLGADIVIGKGLSEVGGFELYEGSLIFYSLGDFIANTGLVTELNANSEGLIAGIWVTPQSYKVHLFRVVVESGYPKFVPYTDNDEFFGEYFLGVPSITEDPELGTIEIAR